MSKQFRSWNPDQMILFPQAMRDALDEGHIVFRIMDVVQTLDIACVIDRMEEKDPRGTRPYHPRMMLALLMYAYCSGVYSSRRIAAATYDVIPFRVLTGDQHPHFTVVNEFRLRHLDAFIDLFLQVLSLCGRAGLLDLEHVSLDGSKIEANASKHKAMSYGRMRSELERLEGEIRELAAKAAEIDAEEDERYGVGKDAHEIRDELRRREQRLERIAKAKHELEREARQARERELRERAARLRDRAEEEPDSRLQKGRQTRARTAEEEAERLAAEGADATGTDNDGEHTEPEMPLHSIPAAQDGTPTPKAQRNFTDPDSRIMKRGGSYLQGYNCQIVVDSVNQIIVAEAVTNQPPDCNLLAPMVERVRRNTDRLPRRLSADAGYMSEDNVRVCESYGVEPYLAVGRNMHGPRGAQQKPPNQSDAWRAMRAKLDTEEGRRVYAQRKAIVEPVFGQTKEARGFRRFSLRGLPKVRAEWTLVCLCGNLLKLVASGLMSSKSSICAT